MPAPGRLAARAHVWAAATLAGGFAFAALASLTTLFAIHAVVEAQDAMRAGSVPDARYFGALFDVARLSSEVAFLLVLAGAFGIAAALSVEWRAVSARRVILVAPALLVVAALMGPLLHEYSGALRPVQPMDKVPFLLGAGSVLAVLVWTSRATLPLVSAGTATLVAGAVQASVRTAWSPMLGLSLPPLAWENAWAACGFALFAVALAAHAHLTDRSLAASARAQETTEAGDGTAA